MYYEVQYYVAISDIKSKLYKVTLNIGQDTKVGFLPAGVKVQDYQIDG